MAATKLAATCHNITGDATHVGSVMATSMVSAGVDALKTSASRTASGFGS